MPLTISYNMYKSTTSRGVHCIRNLYFITYISRCPIHSISMIRVIIYIYIYNIVYGFNTLIKML